MNQRSSCKNPGSTPIVTQQTLALIHHLANGAGRLIAAPDERGAASAGLVGLGGVKLCETSAGIAALCNAQCE